MENSDKEGGHENLPQEKSEPEKKEFKTLETAEACSNNEKGLIDVPVNSPVKRKSVEIVKDKIKRKRSSDSVQKMCDDELFIDSSDLKRAVLTLDPSEKRADESSIEIPCNMKVREQDFSLINQSTIKENIEASAETSAKPAISESAIEGPSLSDTPEQSKSDFIKKILLEITTVISTNDGMDNSANVKNSAKEKIFSENKTNSEKDSCGTETKTYDSLPSKELLTDVEEYSNIKETCSENEKTIFDTPISSPMKRKCKLTIDDKKKLKRSATNRKDEKLPYSNKQDALLKNAESFDENVNSGTTTEPTNLVTCPVRDEILENPETDFAVHLPRVQQKFLGSTKGTSRTDKCTSVDKTIETDSVTHVVHETSINDTSDQTSSEDDGQRTFMSGFASVIISAFKSLAGVVSNPPKTNICESTSDSKTGDATPENFSEVDFDEDRELDLAEQTENELKLPSKRTNIELQVSREIPVEIEQLSTDESTPGISKIRKSCKGSEKDPSQEEKIMGGSPPRLISRTSPVISRDDPEFKLIPIYESKYISLEDLQKDTEFVETQKQILNSISQRRSVQSIASETDAIDEMLLPEELRGMPPKKQREILNSLKDFLEKQGLTLSDKPSELKAQLKEYAEYLTIAHPQYEKETREHIEKSIMLREIQRSPDQSPPKSPDQPPPIDDKAVYPKYREYPGLAEEPTKVKKDARYQKKFYKQKPVRLPINWSEDRTSNTDVESKVDSKTNQKHNFGDDPRTRSVFTGNEDCKFEESKYHDKLPVKDENLIKKEKYEGDQTAVTVRSGGYEISSFMEESPADSSKSNSPNRDDEKKRQSLPENLTTPSEPIAGPISSSQAVSPESPSSQAVSPESPSSQAVSPESPSSQAGSPQSPR